MTPLSAVLLVPLWMAGLLVPWLVPFADTGPVSGIDLNLVALLLGPFGLTVGLLYVVRQFSSGQWLGKERADELRALVKETTGLLDKALDGVDGVAKATEERNRLEAARIEDRRLAAGLPRSSGLSDELAGTEDRIRRPKPQR